MTTRRNEDGFIGCLIAFVAFILVVAWILSVTVFKDTATEDECYTTGQPGSAQYERDLQDCIRNES